MTSDAGNVSASDFVVGDLPKPEVAGGFGSYHRMPDINAPTEYVEGVLDIANEGSGLLRPKFAASESDVNISASQIRRFGLRVGDLVGG